MKTARKSAKAKSEVQEMREWYRKQIVHTWGEHRRECVCIAAMLNSTMTDVTYLEGENAKAMLLDELEDYARYEGTESGQFDIPATKKFLEALSKSMVLQLLHDMGKSPISQVNAFDSWKWGQFIDALGQE